MFATLQVPERDSPIIAATGEPAAIGAHLECMHRALMGFSHLYALPAVNIPPAQHSVTASTDERLPTWPQGHCKGHPRRLRQGSHPLPAVRLPHEQFPALSLPLAATSRGQPPPIGAPGHAPDSPRVSRQPLLLHAIRGVPHIYDAIIASTDQPRAVWTPGHATYPGRQLMPDPPVGTRRHLPHVHPLQIGSASQLLPVRTPGHCEEDGVGVVGVLVPLYAGTRGRIPQPDGIIPPATG